VAKRIGRDEEERLFLAAIEHPLRARILVFFSDRVASAGEIAEQLDEPPSRVRYHLRALRAAGLIDTESTELRRGVVKRYFILNSRGWVDDDLYGRISPCQRRHLTNFWLRLIVGDITRAVRVAPGHVTHPPLLARVRLELDAKGWEEMLGICREITAQLEALKQDAAHRIEDRSADGLPVTATFTALPLPVAEALELPTRADTLRLIAADIRSVVRSDMTHDEYFPCTVRVRMEIDERGWAELEGVCAKATGRFEHLRQSAARRMKVGASRSTIAVAAAMMALELPAGTRGNLPEPSLENTD
jgi:DNA-binding transcriptional ArsR family regulator